MVLRHFPKPIKISQYKSLAAKTKVGDRQNLNILGRVMVNKRFPLSKFAFCLYVLGSVLGSCYIGCSCS